jgi:CSLREA domain-containing protein
MDGRHTAHTARHGRLGRLGLAILLATVASLGGLQPPVAHAATFTVNSTLDEPDALPGDGACKASPSGTCTLRAAIEEANVATTLDTINVPSGSYTLSLGELRVTGPTNIIGAGTTTTILQAAERPGLGRHRVLSVWEASGLRTNVAVVSLTVRHGGLAPTDFGALDISGGGILVGPGATLRLESVLVTRNEASVPISTTTVGFGGGIALVGANGLEIIRSTVSSNLAASQGGGIHCNFFSQSTRPFYRVVDSNVIGNSSRIKGGGIDGFLCPGVIERSTIASNQAGVGAGGINHESADLQVLNSTIASNTLDEGSFALVTARTGGLRVVGGNAHLLLKNVTLADNVARVNNPGSDTAHNLSLGQAFPVTAANTVVALRPGGSGPNCAFSSTGAQNQTIRSLGGNVEFPGQTCRLTPEPSVAVPDLINVDPRLSSLGDNGGRTQTIPLQTTSPAIDLIPGAGCFAVDQRSLPRPRDGNGDGVSRCDSGAFEVQSPPVGTFSLAPNAATLGVGQRHLAALTWTVTEGTWHTLKSIQVRLRQDGRDSGRSPEAHTALHFQWDQDTNAVHQIDSPTGRLGPPAALGSEAVLESPRAALYLKDFGIKGGGPDKPDVAFTMSLSFRPPAEEWTYAVEVAATNDNGAAQGFAVAGTISVQR